MHSKESSKKDICMDPLRSEFNFKTKKSNQQKKLEIKIRTGVINIRGGRRVNQQKQQTTGQNRNAKYILYNSKARHNEISFALIFKLIEINQMSLSHS